MEGFKGENRDEEKEAKEIKKKKKIKKNKKKKEQNKNNSKIIKTNPGGKRTQVYHLTNHNAGANKKEGGVNKK